MDRSRETNQDLSRDSGKGKLPMFSLRSRFGEISEGTQNIDKTKKELSDAIDSVCENIICIKEYMPQDISEFNLGRLDHHMKKIKKYEGMLEQKDVNEQEYRQKISHCKSLIAKYYLPDEFSRQLIKGVEDFNVNLSKINNKMKSLGKIQ